MFHSTAFLLHKFSFSHQHVDMFNVVVSCCCLWLCLVVSTVTTEMIAIGQPTAPTAAAASTPAKESDNKHHPAVIQPNFPPTRDLNSINRLVRQPPPGAATQTNQKSSKKNGSYLFCFCCLCCFSTCLSIETFIFPI